MANITGWGRGTWSEGDWGEFIPVSVTGVSATISLPNITDGLTVDFDRTAFTSFTLGTAVRRDITWQTDSTGILLKSSYTEGEIWWELGGEGQGAYLGIAKINNQYFIRFRSGAGSTSYQQQSDSSDMALVNLSVSDPSVSRFFDDQRHIVTFSIDVTNNKLLVWIDNILVIDYDATANGGNVLQSGQWSGSNAGGYGQSFGAQVAGGSSTYDGGATQYQYLGPSSTIESGSLLFQINNQIPNAEEYPVEVNGSALVTPTGVSSGAVLGTAIGVAESVYPLTGVQSNTATGTVSLSIDQIISVTGLQANSAVATPDIAAGGNITVNAPADQMDFAIGSVIAESEAIIPIPAGVEITSTLGTTIIESAYSLTGSQSNTSVGTTTIESAYTLTGEEIDTEIGTPTFVGNALVEPTAVTMQFADGMATAIANAVAEVTGLSMAFTDGTATATGTAIVIPTSLNATVSLGNMRSTPWANVVPGVSDSWTNVNTNASNTWTEVAA